MSGNEIPDSQPTQTPVQHHTQRQPDVTPQDGNNAISTSLVQTVTDQPAPSGSRRNVGGDTVITIPEGAGLGHYAHLFQVAKYRLAHPEHVTASLRTFIDPNATKNDLKAAALTPKGVTLQHFNRKSNHVGGIKNDRNRKIDTVALLPSTLNAILRWALLSHFHREPGEKPHRDNVAVGVSALFVTFQVGTMIYNTDWSAKELDKTVAEQAPERAFVPDGMADSADVSKSRQKLSTARSEMDTAIAAGVHGAELAPLAKSTEDALRALEYTMQVNVDKLKSTGRENIGKGIRQAIVSGGSTLALTLENTTPNYPWIAQVAGTGINWGMQKFILGPWQERGLVHLPMERKLPTVGPKIAREAAQRALKLDTVTHEQMTNLFSDKFVPDRETIMAMSGLGNSEIETRAGFALPFFSDDQMQAQRAFAQHIGMNVRHVEKMDTLLLKQARANPPAAPVPVGDGIHPIPAADLQPVPGKPLTDKEAADLQGYLDTMNAQIAAVHPDHAGDTARLKADLDNVRADIHRLELGGEHWMQIEEGRQATLLAIMSGDNAAVSQTVMERSGKVWSQQSANLVQRISVILNFIVMNSNALILWSAVRQFMSALGSPVGKALGLSITWGLWALYMVGTIYGGSLATNLKLNIRAAWGATYKYLGHQGPTPWHRRALVAKASFAGVFGVPVEMVQVPWAMRQKSKARDSLATARPLLPAADDKGKSTKPAPQSA